MAPARPAGHAPGRGTLAAGVAHQALTRRARFCPRRASTTRRATRRGPGHRVLITAAAGGVGHLAVQIAKSLGAYVIGTARTVKHSFVSALGANCRCWQPWLRPPNAFALARRCCCRRCVTRSCWRTNWPPSTGCPGDAFGISDPELAAWPATRLLPQPLRTFAEPTRLSHAVDRIPGTAFHCRPQTYPSDKIGEAIGYPTHALDGPHDVVLADPELITRALWEIRAGGPAP